MVFLRLYIPYEVRDILGKLKENGNGFALVFELLNFDKPVVSHDKLGAADHSSADKDALSDPLGD